MLQAKGGIRVTFSTKLLSDGGLFCQDLLSCCVADCWHLGHFESSGRSWHTLWLTVTPLPLAAMNSKALPRVVSLQNAYR